MGKEKLMNLAIISIDPEQVQSLNYDEVVTLVQVNVDFFKNDELRFTRFVDLH